jgi:hypothetical protein
MNSPAPAPKPLGTNETDPQPPAPQPESQAIELERIDPGKTQGDAMPGESLRIQEMPPVTCRPLIFSVDPESPPGIFPKPLDRPRDDSTDLVKTLIHQAIRLRFKLA